jgi:hypothetical protein
MTVCAMTGNLPPHQTWSLALCTTHALWPPLVTQACTHDPTAATPWIVFGLSTTTKRLWGAGNTAMQPGIAVSRARLRPPFTECNCAVYYNARFTEHPGGYVIVDGVAGLDSGYSAACGGEGGQFRWILKNAEGMPEGMLVVGDWHNCECVPADVL